MNTDVKKKWVDALRSGNYEQDSSSSLLRSPDGYCCLGVLCDLAEREGVVESSPEIRATAYGAEKATAYLPAEVMEWAGLSRRNPEVRTPAVTNLALLNDRGNSFDVIANVIEREL